MTPLRHFAPSPRGTPPVALQSRFHAGTGRGRAFYIRNASH
jgi:hypothetical protein